MTEDFYVYVLFRPWDGSPCYVGKGRGKRWRHFSKNRNPHLRNIIAKADGEIPHIKIRSGLTETEAFSIERAFIKAIGRGSHGPLVNMTDGGEGVCGLIVSAETRAKKSAALRGRIFSEEHKAKLRIKNSDEMRKRKSISAMGRVLSAETRAKIRVAASKRVLSAETRAKMSVTRLGKKKSEEHKRKLSEAQIGKFVSAETRAKISAARRRRLTDGEAQWERTFGFG